MQLHMIIQDFNHEKIVAPAYNDGGVIGSKIALFGCPVEKALETIALYSGLISSRPSIKNKALFSFIR